MRSFPAAHDVFRPDVAPWGAAYRGRMPPLPTLSAAVLAAAAVGQFSDDVADATGNRATKRLTIKLKR